MSEELVDLRPYRVIAATTVRYDLPDGAGAADVWIAVINDPKATNDELKEASRELRRLATSLGARAIRDAQDRRSAMEEDRWWNGLSLEEQRELLRKGEG